MGAFSSLKPLRQRMLVHFSKSQIDTFVTAQLRAWHQSMVALLRDCFPERLHNCDDAAITALCTELQQRARAYSVTSEAELTCYAISATLLGAEFATDWQYSWLFNEFYGVEKEREHGCLNFGTALANLERAVELGVVTEDPTATFQQRCQSAALLAIQHGGNAGIVRALSWLNQPKAALLGDERIAHFIDNSLARAQQAEAPNSILHLMLAWTFGHGFVEDPLCRDAVLFLRQSPVERANGR